MSPENFDPKSKEQIERDISGLEEMLYGFESFQRAYNNDFFNERFEPYVQQLEELSVLDYRKHIGPKAVLQKMREILDGMRTAALASEISADDITDEKLKGYYQMQLAQNEQDFIKLRQDVAGGKSPADAIIDSVFKKPTEH